MMVSGYVLACVAVWPENSHCIPFSLALPFNGICLLSPWCDLLQLQTFPSSYLFAKIRANIPLSFCINCGCLTLS